jgi:hypothetical protein
LSEQGWAAGGFAGRAAKGDLGHRPGFQVSPSRISQFRRGLKDCWEEFQDQREPMARMVGMVGMVGLIGIEARIHIPLRETVIGMTLQKIEPTGKTLPEAIAPGLMRRLQNPGTVPGAPLPELMRRLRSAAAEQLSLKLLPQLDAGSIRPPICHRGRHHGPTGFVLNARVLLPHPDENRSPTRLSPELTQAQASSVAGRQRQAAFRINHPDQPQKPHGRQRNDLWPSIAVRTVPVNLPRLQNRRNSDLPNHRNDQMAVGVHHVTPGWVHKGSDNYWESNAFKHYHYALAALASAWTHGFTHSVRGVMS